MLESLRIRNYALIDDIEIDFAEGLNVLTGETGAGKSIIVDALNLALGARASSDTVRTGAKQAKIDAIFRIAKPSRRLARLLKENDVELEEGALLLSRTVTQEGRSRGYVCGNLVPITALAAVGDELVDLHGQHEHQSVLRPDRQLELLDGFAGGEDLAAAVADLVVRLREDDRTIAQLESDDRDRARRTDFLRFEVEEIDAARLEVDEEESLKGRRNLITNAERIFKLSSHAYAVLYGNEELPAINAVDAALVDLEDLANIDQRFRVLADPLRDLRINLEQIVSELRNYTNELEYDPAELNAVNERLVLISALKRKYGDSIRNVLEYRNRAAAELSVIERRDEQLAETRTRRARLHKEAEEKALDLSKKRKAAARKLDGQITSALQDLGMKHGRFQTQFECPSLSFSGIDRVEFLLAANPGEKLKPLRQVASGGEISRIMLGLKAVFAEADKIPTLIFDEIDAGVGGHMARNVADKLRELAGSHQTICITHIAQIAAAAHTHYHVAKSTTDNRAKTTVARVMDQDRVQEIARLLDGSVSDVSLRHARELLKQRHH